MTMRVILLAAITTAAALGQAVEKPAEMRALENEASRLIESYDHQIQQQKASQDRALQISNAAPKDLDARIVAIGEGIKVLRLMVDRDSERINYIRKYRELAVSHAENFESRELDQELDRQSQEAERAYQQSLDELRRRMEEAQSTNTPDTQERLSRAVGRTEQLRAVLLAFRESQAKERDAAKSRLEMAVALRARADEAQAKIETFQTKIALVKATMSSEMIDLRRTADEKTLGQIASGIPDLFKDHDPVFEQLVRRPKMQFSGSVNDRARQLLEESAALTAGKSDSPRNTSR